MRRADCSVRVGHRHERLLFKEVSTGEYLLVEVLLLVLGNNVLRLLLYFCQGARPWFTTLPSNPKPRSPNTKP